MTDNTIYRDIATRTGGDIYIGVVGPVRTGKSTFIQKLLENLVIPNISDPYDKKRAEDVTPQSASGRTVMTTEPKFVPDESVKIRMEDSTELNIKMIDCVGYLTEGALGTEENGLERMVLTPWRDEPMPFKEAAELGTDKVIEEHSTIAILVTSDGSFGEISRESYRDAEEKVAKKLQEKAKPFAILLNSKYPNSDEAHELARELEKKYNAPVALVNCLSLSADDIGEILKLVLNEFPITSLTFSMPEWCDLLPEGHPIYTSILEKIDSFTECVTTLGDIDRQLQSYDGISTVSLSAKDGTGEFNIPLPKEEFYSAMSEACGINIRGEKDLYSTVISLAETDRKYKKIEAAIEDVNEKGYGIVMPSPDELVLEEPHLSKQNNGYGVKIGARADSIHMIKAGIKTEICPVVGTEEQGDEVIKYLTAEIEDDPKRVLDSNMFGKSLYDMISDGLYSKLSNIPDESREKLAKTLERIVNEGANGLVCILI